MHHLCTPVYLTLWLLLGIAYQSSQGLERIPIDEDTTHLVSVQTYFPSEFHQGSLDRLSGGIAQHLASRMVVDSRGRILVTGPQLSVVHVFDTREGSRYQIRGDHQHRLMIPTFIAVDADNNVYVTDLQISAVVVLQPDGGFKRILGSGVFDAPAGIWVDSKNRRLDAVDSWRGEILSFDLEGRLLFSFGTRGSGSGQLQGPSDVVLHEDTLFDSSGNFNSVLSFGMNRRPLAFALDAAGHLYFVDRYSGGLVAMDTSGATVAGFERRPFGQWVPRSASQPRFACVAQDAGGKRILALRLAFEVQALTLVGR